MENWTGKTTRKRNERIFLLNTVFFVIICWFESRNGKKSWFLFSNHEQFVKSLFFVYRI